MADAITTQAAPSATNLDCFKGGPPQTCEGSGGADGSPARRPHMRILMALVYYPNKLDRRAAISRKSQEANESSINASRGMTHQEHRGKRPAELQSGILILTGRHCQGGSCYICSHRTQFFGKRNTCS